MKTIVIFLFGIVFLSQSIFAQTVFAPTGATWTYYFYSDDDISYNIKYTSEKDTLYEGKYCAKVSGIKTMGIGGTSVLKPTYFYTSGDTVFYYHDSFKIFTPIYIFNVMTGDTLTLLKPGRLLMPGKPTTFKMVVDRLETNIIDGVALRTVYTEALPSEITWLKKYTERFGGWQVADIISIIGIVTGNHTQGLRCYSDSAIEENFSTDGFDCDYITANISEQLIKHGIKMYPNPASGNTLFIEMPGRTSRLEISIITIDGKIVSQSSLSGGNSSINISNLAPGLYFIRFASDEGMHLQKLVVE